MQVAPGLVGSGAGAAGWWRYPGRHWHGRCCLAPALSEVALQRGPVGGGAPAGPVGGGAPRPSVTTEVPGSTQSPPTSPSQNPPTSGGVIGGTTGVLPAGVGAAAPAASPPVAGQASSMPTAPKTSPRGLSVSAEDGVSSKNCTRSAVQHNGSRHRRHDHVCGVAGAKMKAALTSGSHDV